MSIDDPVKAAQEAVNLIGEVIKAAGDNPNVQEAGQELGKSALTITKTINNALLPLAAVNFAFDKARAYFAQRFLQDLSQKAERVPPENIVEPKASVAGPALQGLAFCHEEHELKEMYLNLIASAMDGRIAEGAHPAFVEIIKQLNAEEARLLSGILRSQAGLPIVEIRLKTVGEEGWITLHRHLLDLRNAQNGQPAESAGLAAMADNWTRLGLVEIDYATYLTDETKYNWVEHRPEWLRVKEQYEKDQKKIEFQKGMMSRTAFGIQFARIVGLLAQ